MLGEVWPRSRSERVQLGRKQRTADYQGSRI
jgi:hypothetical protein